MHEIQTWIWQANIWLEVAVAAGIVVLLSSYADRRRAKRTDIERVGFMPWTSITLMSVLVAVVAAALAIKGA